MIQRIGAWVRRVVGQLSGWLHLTPTNPMLEDEKQNQEAIRNMAARAQAEYREKTLRAELEKLRLIQKARHGA